MGEVGLPQVIHTELSATVAAVVPTKLLVRKCMTVLSNISGCAVMIGQIDSSRRDAYDAPARCGPRGQLGSSPADRASRQLARPEIFSVLTLLTDRTRDPGDVYAPVFPTIVLFGLPRRLVNGPRRASNSTPSPPCPYRGAATPHDPCTSPCVPSSCQDDEAQSSWERVSKAPRRSGRRLNEGSPTFGGRSWSQLWVNQGRTTFPTLGDVGRCPRPWRAFSLNRR